MNVVAMKSVGAPARVDLYQSANAEIERLFLRCCQTNANQSPKWAEAGIAGCQLTPHGQGGGAVLFEDVMAVQVAILVEMIMDRGMDSGEEHRREILVGERAVKRRQAVRGPAMLSQGFRPFFLLAGIWAPLSMGLFVAMYQGHIALPTAFDAVVWHYHEMLFGYVAAVLAGFALTAIPNWTGRLPLQGAPLLGLVLLWLAGRVAVAISALIGPWAAAAVDVLFLAALAAVFVREIVAGQNWRNLPLVVAVVLFFLSNVFIHYEALGLIDSGGRAQKFPIAIIIVLIALIGGRIIPSFSRNWLAKRTGAHLPTSFGQFDRLALAVTLVALVWWAAAPLGPVTGGLAALAAALNLIRLARWQGLATGTEPLLWVMHLGYLWIPVGLVLLALASWLPGVPHSIGVHALTVGAIGTMTLAVMSRATLGHTGQPLQAGVGLTLAYLLVTAAVVLRIAALLWGGLFTPLVLAAAVAWIAAFLFYLGACGPVLVKRH